MGTDTQASPSSEITTPQAMAALRNALKHDSDYAWTWHCNLACAVQDEGVDHATANRAAARFMQILAEVDTSKHPQYSGKSGAAPNVTTALNIAGAAHIPPSNGSGWVSSCGCSGSEQYVDGKLVRTEYLCSAHQTKSVSPELAVRAVEELHQLGYYTKDDQLYPPSRIGTRLEAYAWLYTLKEPGRVLEYASVDKNERRDHVTDKMWETRKVEPLCLMSAISNREEMLAEDIEVVHKCLDDKQVPRLSENGTPYSIWGRVQVFLVQCHKTLFDDITRSCELLDEATACEGAKNPLSWWSDKQKIVNKYLGAKL